MQKTEKLSPLQQQFFSQDICKVTIRPLQHIDKLTMIIENYGPFEIDQKYEVPLWLAIHLKKIKMCRIDIPDWLLISSLEYIIEQEHSEDEFTPYHIIIKK